MFVTLSVHTTEEVQFTAEIEQILQLYGKSLGLQIWIRMFWSDPVFEIEVSLDSGAFQGSGLESVFLFFSEVGSGSE